MPFALIPRAWQGQVPNQLLTTTRKKGREGGVGVECSSCRWALAHALRAGLSIPWNRPCTLARTVLFPKHWARVTVVSWQPPVSPHCKLLSYPPKCFLEHPSKWPHSVSNCSVSGLLFSVSLETASPTPAAIVQDTHTSRLQKPSDPLSTRQNAPSSTAHQGKSASAASRQPASRPDVQVPVLFPGK